MVPPEGEGAAASVTALLRIPVCTPIATVTAAPAPRVVHLARQRLHAGIEARMIHARLARMRRAAQAMAQEAAAQAA